MKILAGRARRVALVLFRFPIKAAVRSAEGEQRPAQGGQALRQAARGFSHCSFQSSRHSVEPSDITHRLPRRAPPRNGHMWHCDLRHALEDDLHAALHI